MDYVRFLRDRITHLRLKKGVSEYQMSLSLGHSRSYIQGITSGRKLLSFTEFFYMCDYFEISPKDFFDDGIVNPILIQKAVDGMKDMHDKDVITLIYLIDRLKDA